MFGQFLTPDILTHLQPLIRGRVAGGQQLQHLILHEM